MSLGAHGQTPGQTPGQTMRELRSLVFLLALFVPYFANADGSISTQSISQNEKLRGKFTQERHLTGFKAPLHSEGVFLLAPSHGLIWRSETPFAVTTVITPQGLAQEVNGNQTLRLQTTQIPFLGRLYDIVESALAGDWSKLEADFVMSRTEDDKRWRVVLTPRNAHDLEMPFRAIDVTGTRFVESVTLTKPDGDFDQLFFLNQALSDGPLTDAEVLIFDSVKK